MRKIISVGSAGQFVKEFCETVRPNGLGCDWGMDLEQIDAQTGKQQVLQGNLDPLCLLRGGVTLEKEVRYIVQQTKLGRHIFNLGHGILPETPIEHVELMLDTLRAAEKESA